LEKLESMIELFGRKEKIIKNETSIKSEEVILKEGLEDEIQELQKIFRAKKEEIKDNEEKLNSVKKEYEHTVSSLMELKKEANQKNFELDVVKREYKDLRKKIEDGVEKLQKDKSIVNEIEKNELHLKNVKQELEKLSKMESEISKKVSEGETVLYKIKLQETQNQNKLEENIQLNNKSKDSTSRDNTFIFSDKEKEFIKDQIGPDQYTKGVIEAASVVTASLKSKLNVAYKELEAIQRLLEQERKAHTITKEVLEKLQNKSK
jgi:hypothetical protein